MRRHVLTGWVGVCVLSATLFGFQALPPAQQGPKVIEVEKVKDNFYVLRGGGGATAVFITQKNGVVVVDTKNPSWGSVLIEKIKSITDKPISTVILTHTHADHTGGLVEFPAGIAIVAQENTKTNMEKMDLFKKPENQKFLPNKTYKDNLKLFSGPDEVDVYFFGPGGTNGDSWIVFRSLGILAAGDNFAAKGTNLMDESNGGGGTQARTIRAVAENIKNVTTVIPSHADLLYTWADLQEYADYNEEFLDWALAEKKAGKTVDEATAEYKYPGRYAKTYAPPNLGFVRRNLQAIYNMPASTR